MNFCKFEIHPQIYKQIPKPWLHGENVNSNSKTLATWWDSKIKSVYPPSSCREDVFFFSDLKRVVLICDSSFQRNHLTGTGECLLTPVYTVNKIQILGPFGTFWDCFKLSTLIDDFSQKIITLLKWITYIRDLILRILCKG